MSEPLRPACRAGLLAAALVLAACPNPPETPCPQECEQGFSCDESSGECIADPAPELDTKAPGRAVRLASVGDEVLFASIDPPTRQIVVGNLTAQGPVDVHAITTLARVEEKRVGLTATPQRVAVIWIGAQNQFQFAVRATSGENAFWEYGSVRAEAGAYAATESFDVATNSAGRIHLVFQDRDGTVRRLSAGEPDRAWELATIDDGSPTVDGIACPASRRSLSAPGGVGAALDAAIRDDVLWIAYFDADCGHLRLARETTDGWVVSAVDSGQEISGSAGADSIVGAHPSLAFRPDGGIGVAYQDVTRGRLLFASEEDGRFRVETVDSGSEIDDLSRETKEIVGAFSRLSFDTRGGPTVTYFNATTQQLRLARRVDSVDSAWTQRSLDGDGIVGFFADHVVRNDGSRVVVAERIVPSADGLASELVVVWGLE